jgi:protein AroM
LSDIRNGKDVRARPRTLGTITIGQSPRPDLIPELRLAMGLTAEARSDHTVRILEAGALDGLTMEEVRELEPRSGDYVLVTRMADGTAVKIAERHILPRMQAHIHDLASKGADVIALVCTGEFPRFECERLLVEPQKVLHHAVAAVAQGRRLGVLLPDEDQIPQGVIRWSSVWEDNPGQSLRIEAASPYDDVRLIEAAASSLRDWGADLVVMDCIGYTMAMKELVKAVTRAPVILARSILGRTLAELL